MIDLDVPIPEEWFTEILELQVFTADQKLGVAFCGALLDGGTNVMAVSYRGGCRLVRIAAETGWKVDMRFTGDPPGDDAVEVVDKFWAMAIKTLEEANEMTRALEQAGKLTAVHVFSTAAMVEMVDRSIDVTFVARYYVVAREEGGKPSWFRVHRAIRKKYGQHGLDQVLKAWRDAQADEVAA